MGAIAATLGFLFPEQAAYLNRMADEAGESRIWAGIHYHQDVAVGLALGRAVTNLLVGHAAAKVQP
jgi:hypothetical protein